MNNKAQTFIKQARERGYGDDEIKSFLKKKGVEFNPGEATKNKDKSTPRWEDLPGNIIPSGSEALQSLISPITKPIQTGRSLLGTASGAAEKLIPGVSQAKDAIPGFRKVEETILGGSPQSYTDNALNFYKQRYGVDKLQQGDVQGAGQSVKNTVIKDPVGVALDIATALEGAGAARGSGAVSKAGRAGELSKVTNTEGILGRVPGEILNSYIPRPDKGSRLKEATNVLFKGEEKLGQKFAEYNKIPFTSGGVAKKARELASTTYKERQKLLKPFENKKVNIFDDVLDPKVVDEGRMTLTKLRQDIVDSIIPNKAEVLTDLDKMVDDLLSKSDNQGNIKIGELDNIRSKTDKVLDRLHQSGKSIKEMTPREGLQLQMVNEMRNVINDLVPGIREVNERYGTYKAMEKAAIPVFAKANVKLNSFDIPFGLAGFTLGNVPGMLSALAVRRIITSPVIGLSSARMLQELLGGASKVKKTTPSFKGAAAANYLLGRPQNVKDAEVMQN